MIYLFGPLKEQVDKHGTRRRVPAKEGAKGFVQEGFFVGTIEEDEERGVLEGETRAHFLSSWTLYFWEAVVINKQLTIILDYPLRRT